MTIGQVAKCAAVGVETVRFYERQGLIDTPPRRASGYREYPPDTVDRVRFIQRAKELGFSLREIRDLMTLRITPAATCDQVKKRALAKLLDIEDRIGGLQRMKQALHRLVAACDGEGPVGDCPILEALDKRRDTTGKLKRISDRRSERRSGHDGKAKNRDFHRGLPPV